MFRILIILLMPASLSAFSQNRDSVFNAASDRAMHHALNVHRIELARLVDMSVFRQITDGLRQNVVIRTYRCKPYKRKRLNTL